MRKIVMMGLAPVFAAGMVAVGTADASAMVHPNALCTYTTNQTTSVYSSPSTSAAKLYTVASGTTVYAVNTDISGTGGPFYQGEAAGKATGYIQVSHLSNQRACAVSPPQ